MATFTQSQLQAIADALGDTGDGRTGSEIGYLLATVNTVMMFMTRSGRPTTV